MLTVACPCVSPVSVCFSCVLVVNILIFSSIVFIYFPILPLVESCSSLDRYLNCVPSESLCSFPHSSPPSLSRGAEFPQDKGRSLKFSVNVMTLGVLDGIRGALRVELVIPSTFSILRVCCPGHKFLEVAVKDTGFGVVKP